MIGQTHTHSASDTPSCAAGKTSISSADNYFFTDLIFQISGNIYENTILCADKKNQGLFADLAAQHISQVL